MKGYQLNMYKLCMILNENGTEIKQYLKNKVITVVSYTVGGNFSFVDISTGRSYTVRENIIGVCYENGFLVIKNEKSTYCCMALG